MIGRQNKMEDITYSNWKRRNENKLREDYLNSVREDFEEFAKQSFKENKPDYIIEKRSITKTQLSKLLELKNNEKLINIDMIFNEDPDEIEYEVEIYEI